MWRHISLPFAVILLLTSAFSAEAQDSSERPVITPENAGQVVQLVTLGRGWIHQIAWSPDGTTLAVASSNGVFLYDTADWGAPPRELPGYERAAINLAWDPNGNRLATVDAEGYLRLWKIDTQTVIELEIAQPPITESMEPYYRDSRVRPRALAFRADGAVMVDIFDAVFSEESNRIWNTKRHSYLSEDEYRIEQDVIIFPDGTWMTRQPWIVFIPEKQIIAIGTCPPYGDRWRCPSAQGVVNLIDLTTGKALPLHTEFYQTDSIGISRVTATSDGQLLAAGGCTTLNPADFASFCLDYHIELYDLESREKLIRLTGNFINQPISIAFNPGGTYIAAADSSLVRVWDITTGDQVAVLGGYGGPVDYLVFHPSGKFLVSGHVYEWAEGGSAINLWDSASFTTGEALATLQGTGPFAFYPDDTTLLAGNIANYFSTEPGRAAVWDIAYPTRPRQIRDSLLLPRLDSVNSLDSNSSRSFLAATIDGGGTLILFEGDKFIGYANAGSSLSSEVKVSRNGEFIALTDYVGVYLFDTQILLHGNARLNKDDVFFAIEGDFGAYGAAFSPDDRLLATVSKSNDVYIWNVESRAQVAIIEDVTDTGYFTGLSSPVFSPDGRLLAVGGCAYSEYPDVDWRCDKGSVWLIDMETFEIVAQLEEHSESVNAIAFSPDGTLLVSGSRTRSIYDSYDTSTDNRVRVWGIPAE